MLASDFEFRHRTWFIFGIFCVGLACYRVDQQVSGEVLARTLRSHIGLWQKISLRTSIRAIFLVGAFIVTLGGLIRAWGAAYLRAEVVHDSSVRTERLVADGPFRYSRNPLYLGLLIGVFGAGPLFSRTGWVVQMILALVFCYRLVFQMVLFPGGGSFAPFITSISPHVFCVAGPPDLFILGYRLLTIEVPRQLSLTDHRSSLRQYGSSETKDPRPHRR